MATGLKLISHLGSRGIVLSRVAKTKVLISCVVTTQLICACVFAYVKSRFSHDKALIIEPYFMVSFTLTIALDINA